MKLPAFLDGRRPDWQRLEHLLKAAGRRPERLSPDQLRALAMLYRAAAADLATARRRFSADPVVHQLELLVGRARAVVYERAPRRANLIDLFADRYWLLLAERAGPLALAAAVLLVPAVLAGFWASSDPATVANLLPPEFLWVMDADSTDQGLGPVGLAGFSTFVFANNIRVTLVAFVLGVTAGLGTAWLVAYNGLLLGALTGLAVTAGNGRLLAAAVLAHGVLELTCIVVGAGAGFSLARALLRPGLGTRLASLRSEAQPALAIAGATLPWLVVAGLVEGFVSRIGLDAMPTAMIGLSLGAAFWGLFYWRGWLPQRRARRLAAR